MYHIDIALNKKLRKNLFFIFGEITMKAKVYVTLKPSVLDPQGKAIHHSVELLGMENIKNVRQGKYFEIELNSALSEAEAQTAAEKIAKEVLANPVIEDYKVELVLG
jgi:phosphoribosylformylglycinamidine synthase subunit PurS